MDGVGLFYCEGMGAPRSPPPFLLVICWAKMPLAFGAIREGDIRLCTEGKVTRISLSSDLYWSVSESILVSVQTYIGR